jgi:5-methyltetrahydrofolate--homocysteine methyltransferase
MMINSFLGTRPPHILAIAEAVKNLPPRIVKEQPKTLYLSGI